WAVRGLGNAAMPLFAAAGREREAVPELIEPLVRLARMPEGREVVEDYHSVGLSLREHPITFLRDELDGRGMVRAADIPATRDGKRIAIAGIVLVRQKPGSAKGVMFLTIEDETGHANL